MRRIVKPAAGLAAALAVLCQMAGAQAADAVKIGVLTDMSSVYSDFGGKGSVIAAELAIEDAGGKVLGQPVGLVSADHEHVRRRHPALMRAGRLCSAPIHQNLSQATHSTIRNR